MLRIQAVSGSYEVVSIRARPRGRAMLVPEGLCNLYPGVSIRARPRGRAMRAHARACAR